MGQGASRSRNGTCGVPLGQDPRHFALTKVHGVPNDIKYLSLYPGYTKKKACEDIEAWRAGGEAVHRVTQFHKMLRGDLVDDPRTYVFKKIYKLSAAEIAEIGKDDFYTEDMAIKELNHQNKRRKGGRDMTPFRYDPSRSVRFTNVKRDFVYKKGRKGVVTGYAGYRPDAPNFVEKRPKNPKRKMSTRNIWAQAYAQGMANADARHALTRPTPGSFAASPAVSEATSIRPSAPPRPRPTLSTATTIRPSAPPQPLSRGTQPKINIHNFARKTKTPTASSARVTGTRTPGGWSSDSSR